LISVISSLRKPLGEHDVNCRPARPGATVQGAQAEFRRLAKQIESLHPERNTLKPKLSPLGRHVSGHVRPALPVLACAVGVVMLIVCADLCNLQLARMGMRPKEMAVRAALGAGRQRLPGQMLTESVGLRPQLDTFLPGALPD
jgi:hypothetical protein